jgi:hypothetical protein
MSALLLLLPRDGMCSGRDCGREDYTNYIVVTCSFSREAAN